ISPRLAPLMRREWSESCVWVCRPMSYKTRSGGYNRFLMMTRISAWSPGELVEIESYSARLAMSGAGAMQLCHKQAFDAVPFDLKLGAASGLEVLRDLRSQCPDLPVIVVTAHGSLESAAAAEREKAFGYIGKPFPSADLIAVLRRALEWRAG